MKFIIFSLLSFISIASSEEPVGEVSVHVVAASHGEEEAKEGMLFRDIVRNLSPYSATLKGVEFVPDMDTEMALKNVSHVLFNGQREMYERVLVGESGERAVRYIYETLDNCDLSPWPDFARVVEELRATALHSHSFYYAYMCLRALLKEKSEGKHSAPGVSSFLHYTLKRTDPHYSITEGKTGRFLQEFFSTGKAPDFERVLPFFVWDESGDAEETEELVILRRGLQPESLKALRRELRVTPTPVFMPNMDKVGLTVATWLAMNDMWVMAIPTKESRAHGFKFMEEDFYMHDRFHFVAALSMRHTALGWAADLAKKLIEEHGIFYLDATRIAANIAQSRYRKVQRVGQRLLHKATEGFQKIVDEEDDLVKARETYNRVLVCLFQIFHEEYGISSQALSATTDRDRFRALFSSLLEKEDHIKDIAQTDPRTGRSVLDEEAKTEAIKRAFRKLFRWSDELFEGLWDGIQEAVEEPLYVLYKAVLNDGTPMVVSSQTSRLNLGDAKDRRALLRLARVPGVPNIPDLASDLPGADARERANTFIHTLSRLHRELAEGVVSEYGPLFSDVEELDVDGLDPELAEKVTAALRTSMA